MNHSMNMAMRPNLRLNSNSVLKVTRAAAPQQNLMAHQTYLPQVMTQVTKTMKQNIPSLSAEEIAAKKLMLEQRTKELTQHLLARSNQTVRAVSSAGGSAYQMYIKFKICCQHLASYPKVFYLPLMLFFCGLYGFHSVKGSAIPY